MWGKAYCRNITFDTTLIDVDKGRKALGKVMAAHCSVLYEGEGHCQLYIPVILKNNTIQFCDR